MKVSVDHPFVSPLCLLTKPRAKRGVIEKMAAMMMIRNDEQRSRCDAKPVEFRKDALASRPSSWRDIVKGNDDGAAGS